jgi:hypothetical protein
MVIEEGKISMDPGKLKGIREWPAPITVKQVRGFLGFGQTVIDGSYMDFRKSRSP